MILNKTVLLNLVNFLFSFLLFFFKKKTLKNNNKHTAMLHEKVNCRNQKKAGQLVVELLDLLHEEFLFDPRNARCSSRLNKFDSFLCIRIGVYRSKPGWQGLIIVHIRHYTAIVTLAFPAPPYPSLPGIKSEHL